MAANILAFARPPSLPLPPPHSGAARIGFRNLAGALVVRFSHFIAQIASKAQGEQHSSWAISAKLVPAERNTGSVPAKGMFVNSPVIRGDLVAYASLLRRCGDAKALIDGRLLHAHIVKSGYEGNGFVGNLLVEMYGKCGSLQDARSVFAKIYPRNVFSWTIMIEACTRHGEGKEALRLFEQMQVEGVVPNKVTFVCILSACTALTALSEGRQIHACIVARDFESDPIVATALINMYGRCGGLVDARVFFDKMSRRSVVSCNAMIAVYAQDGQSKQALQLFLQMQCEGMMPNKATFVTILSACVSRAALVEGRQIHASILANGLDSNIAVGTALVNMYGKCGSLEDSRRIFNEMARRDVVSWTSMIEACIEHGQGKEALQLFQQMQLGGVIPDKVSFISILSACTSQETLADGKWMHANMINSGLESDVVAGNALVNMYCKCGSLEDARRMFDKMPERDVISWNAMIAAYAQCWQGKEALQLFQQMQLEGAIPDKVTFVSILSVCAEQLALAEGKRIHTLISESGFESDVAVGIALINMYGKCGSLEDACRIFDSIPDRDAVLWTAMIGAYAQHGHGKEALKLFQQMLMEDMAPNEITFLSILSACSHAGLVDEGCDFFISMHRDYGIMPTIEHYNCMIDLLGRAGRLDEGENLINQMPYQATSTAWMTLLAACRIHFDVERARRAAEHVFKLDEENAAPYVLLSNIYAAVGRWDDSAKLWKAMKDKGLKKQPGCSVIEVKNMEHGFYVGDELHPHREAIYAELQSLNIQMQEPRYAHKCSAA